LVLAQELLMKRSENVRRLHDLQHTARFLHMAHGARLARIDAMLDELDLEHADWVIGAPAEWSDEHEPSPNE